MMLREPPNVLVRAGRTLKRLTPTAKIINGVALLLLILVASSMCGSAAAYEIREAPYERVAPLCQVGGCEPVCTVEALTPAGRVCYGWACSCPPIVGGVR